MKNFDVRLGWRLEQDPRSLDYPVSALLTPMSLQVPKSQVWDCPLQLDQKQTSACVGNGWTHLLACNPLPLPGLREDDAQKIYHLAQTLDNFPGTNYNGTSNLGGAKATKELYPNHLLAYRWIFKLEEMIATLGYIGPVVAAVNWYSSFYTPDKNGVVKLGGSRVGGHCFLVIGVDVSKRLFLCKNSWGKRWGKNGNFYISYSDMRQLIAEQGEFAVSTKI